MYKNYFQALLEIDSGSWKSDVVGTGEGIMSVRSVALFLFIQSALSFAPVWASERGGAPAIEMSETAPAAAPARIKRQVSATTDTDVDIVEDSAETEDGEAVEPAQPAEPALSVETAALGARQQAVAPAVAAPADPPAGPPASESVSWWREAASFLGLASDPHPGEIAEAAPGRPPSTPDYIIGAGDQLGISVWRDDNLTRTVVVLPDGKIAFPLVGELVAGGKTVAQLKAELEGKLTRYITDSGLTVEVKQSNSMIVYILGRVNVPGRQMMVASTNVLQGLAMAGGLNPFARRSEVKVFRKQQGKTAVYTFNYDDVSEGRHLETNIDLQKGDVILVP
jgi:polysaccharide biosynthesis/export protein